MDDIAGKKKLWNGVEMPALGLGVYKVSNGKEVIDTIHSAFEAGYRHIDTASYYANEEGVGEAIARSSIKREELFITTKVWNDDQGYEQTIKAFYHSLEKLKLDYLDLYLVHWPVPGKFTETWRALEQLYREGKIRAIGVSNFLQHHLEQVMGSGEIKPMVIQNEFHPKLVQQPLLDYCRSLNIQYEAWAPLMRGRILNEPDLQEIATRYGKSVAQVVLRWNHQKGVIAIPKSVHRERIFENAAIFDFALSPEEVAAIDAMDQSERTGAHPDNFMAHFENADT